MSTPRGETALARLQACREEIERELQQIERQIVAARLQVITIEQQIARLARSQHKAA